MKEQFLNLQGLSEVVDYLKEYISEQSEISAYDSYMLFPSVGKRNAIYIDKSTDAIYRWDDESIKYYPLAFDPLKQYILQCGNSKEV